MQGNTQKGARAKPIQPKKVADQLANIIENHIVTGIYRVGERLPSERRLALDYAVSRPSIRDALSTLAARGLVQSRHGDGHYVSEKLHQEFLSPWQDLLSRNHYLEHEVLEFRRGCEGVVSALAAQNATPSDLERMRFWLDQMLDTTASQSVDEQSNIDVQFHQTIAQASHNVLFAHLSQSLLTMLHQRTQQNLANMFSVSGDRTKLRTQHEAIYAAIAAHNPSAATAAAQAHIDYVATTLNEFRLKEEREQLAQVLAKKDKQA